MTSDDSHKLQDLSDKDYWHRYTATYDVALANISNEPRILEFGVFKGNSIRWLVHKWPRSVVFAADILPVQPEWPVAQNIQYLYVDQGNIGTIEEVFKVTGSNLDLIIEDGSHMPSHQKNCLVLSLGHLSPGGTYILEDIHTSHPAHRAYRKKGKRYIGVLHILLAFENLLANGMDLTSDHITSLAKKSLFSMEEVELLFNQIATITIFKRATLPKRCYDCGTSDFNFHKLECRCGAKLYLATDSMTAIITVN